MYSRKRNLNKYPEPDITTKYNTFLELLLPMGPRTRSKIFNFKIRIL